MTPLVEVQEVSVLSPADEVPRESTPGSSAAVAKKNGRKARLGSPAGYAVLVFFLVALGLGAVAFANRAFAPEMYDHKAVVSNGQALARGENYAVFDLNVNIREIRDAQLAHMRATPDVILLGASHWQEAPVGLNTDQVFFNAHIHRDYYEDLLGMVDMLVRHDKLPRHLLISIRDNQFMPIAERTDHLWLPGVPYYRDMAKRLGLEPHAVWQTAPVARWRELISLQMLYGNAARWHKADERPHATLDRQFDGLDTLLPGGSIVWSRRHAAAYTPERSHSTAMAYVNARRHAPPTIDPVGVASIDRLFGFLVGRGVEVVLVHPPFNPIAYDALSTTPYIDGLRRVEALTRDLADRHGFRVIGGFDPQSVGCVSSMYIDAEHSNSECLGKVLNQFTTGPRDRDPETMNRVESTTLAPDFARLDPMPPPPMPIDDVPAIAKAAPTPNDQRVQPVVDAASSPGLMPPTENLPMPIASRPISVAHDAATVAAAAAVTTMVRPRVNRLNGGKARVSPAARTTRLLSKTPTAVRR